MNIAIKRNIYTRMPKDFTQALNVETQLDTPSRKCVAEGMKIDITDVTFFRDGFKMVFHGARFYITVN